jgi:hypothetical protein
VVDGGLLLLLVLDEVLGLVLEGRVSARGPVLGGLVVLVVVLLLPVDG